MRNDVSATRHPAGGVPRPALALLLCGTALFLAVENAILLFVLAPSLTWPAELEPLALALRIGRVLAEALAPWLAAAMTGVLACGAALWAVLHFRRGVNHA